LAHRIYTITESKIYTCAFLSVHLYYSMSILIMWIGYQREGSIHITEGLQLNKNFSNDTMSWQM